MFQWKYHEKAQIMFNIKKTFLKSHEFKYHITLCDRENAKQMLYKVLKRKCNVHSRIMLSFIQPFSSQKASEKWNSQSWNGQNPTLLIPQDIYTPTYLIMGWNVTCKGVGEWKLTSQTSALKSYITVQNRSIKGYKGVAREQEGTVWSYLRYP